MRLSTPVNPKQRPYRPHGSALDIFYCKDPELLLAGPAGTGKSLAELNKLHLCAEKYNGMRGLICRKTRASLTQSAMVTFETKVLPEGSPVKLHHEDQEYRYPNGSVLVVGGLDKPSKIMSTEFDMVYIQEATEATEHDWESLTTRLRNNVMPYQQIIGDCNPDAPHHWLKQRADSGRLTLIESRHEHNPALYDATLGEWTTEGLRYLATLDNLTGVRYLRLRKGLWAAAEGLIYTDFDPNIHIIDRFDVPDDWTRYWTVDFGFTHPFAWQAWAEDSDGRLYCYRAIHHTRRLVEDHARDILAATASEPRPALVICDHDAEDRATLERHLGMNTKAANKGVSNGIQAVASRLKPAGDGRPRLFIMRDSLVERDPELVEKRRAVCLEDEFTSYVWDTRNQQARGEQPLKEYDDSCFIAGTLIETEHGPRPIEHIGAGERVVTRNGLKPVLTAGRTAIDATVYTAHLSSGASLTGTGNHPVWVDGHGWTPLDALRYGDTLAPCGAKQSPFRASDIDAIQTPQARRRATTSRPVSMTARADSSISTKRYGSQCTVLSQLGMRFTTAISTRSTTIPTISRALAAPITGHCIVPIHGHLRRNNVNTSLPSGRSPSRGINRRLAERGIRNTARGSGVVARVRYVMPHASTAGTRIKPARYRLFASVPIIARQRGGARRVLTMRNDRARSAARRLLSTAIQESNAAVVTVRSISVETEPQPVYNLAVADSHEYFANGVLVHNCDALRYVVATLDATTFAFGAARTGERGQSSVVNPPGAATARFLSDLGKLTTITIPE